MRMTFVRAMVPPRCGGSCCSRCSASRRSSRRPRSPPAVDGRRRPLQVVAAENFWGSIAAQLGGDRVHVTSVISNPATDPHDYEPTAVDARTLAGAQLVIVNGIGYDPWAPKLLAGNPVCGRLVLTVGDVVGIKAGGNPHRWYSPANVQQVIDGDRRRLQAARPEGLGVLRPAAGVVRDEGPRRLQGRDRGDPEEVRRRPGRRLGEHLRAARAGARARSSSRPPPSSRRSARGRSRRRRTSRRSTRRSRAGRSRYGSSTARTARRTCSG